MNMNLMTPRPSNASVAERMSVRSLKSSSTKSSKSDKLGDHEDFADSLKALCMVYACPCPIEIKKEFIREPPMSGSGTATSKSTTKQTPKVSPQKTDTSSLHPMMEYDDLLTITAKYSISRHLTEIIINKYRFEPVPRPLLLILQVMVPYYSELTKFTITNSCIDKYTTHEISKMLPISGITDICLDGCPVPEANYDVLLQSSSWLKSLSLCRCDINDDVCAQIASALQYSKPGEYLTALNLTSNDITDVGAKALAEVLRCNRHLRYLNLSDNHIGDEGAIHLFSVLMDFPMTFDEILQMRRELIKYYKKKQALYTECLHQFVGDHQNEVHRHSDTTINQNQKTTNVKSAKRRSTPILKKKEITKSFKKTLSFEGNELKAKLMAEELLGPFKGPFIHKNVREIDGISYSIGNMVLCYLNLAYNNLSLISLKKLVSVLEYQEPETRNTCRGLMKIILDGNYLPKECSELSVINELLTKKLISCLLSQTPSGSAMRKSHIPRRSVFVA